MPARWRRLASGRRQKRSPNSTIRTSCGFTTSANKEACPTSAWNSSRAATWTGRARTSWRSRGSAAPVEAVARAVHHAHQRGVLHRDLKPANILLDAAGQPHVTDFGLAKRFDNDRNLTVSGEKRGTPKLHGSGTGVREEGECLRPRPTYTESYAILYKLLTGRPPFKGDGLMDTYLPCPRKGTGAAAGPQPRRRSRSGDDLA